MVRSAPIQGGDNLWSAPLAIGLFISVSALVALCAKHVTRRHPTKYAVQSQAEPSEKSGGKADKEYGEGGLWQKSILMGEKCQPPEFSGVIYYDPFGNQISELPPKSPRAPSSLRNYLLPVGENLS